MNQLNSDINYPELDYFMREELCDVVFVVEGHRIPAVKQLLSVKSRVFRAKFSGNFSDSKHNVFPIEDTTVEAFKTFIRFLLTEILLIKDENDFQLLGEVFRLSDIYEVLRLSNKVNNSFKSKLDLANLAEVARVASDYHMQELMKIVLNFCWNKINEIIRKDIEELSEINDCTNNLLFHILTSHRVTNGNDLAHFRVEDRNLYVKREILARSNLSALIETSAGYNNFNYDISTPFHYNFNPGINNFNNNYYHVPFFCFSHH